MKMIKKSEIKQIIEFINSTKEFITNNHDGNGNMIAKLTNERLKVIDKNYTRKQWTKFLKDIRIDITTGEKIKEI